MCSWLNNASRPQKEDRLDKVPTWKFPLETTLRSELIPGYQAWASAAELPVPRWEDLINTFQKSNSTICLKFIFDHKIDILKPGPLISKNKLIRDKRVTPRQQIWLQDCIYSDEEGPFHWETAWRHGTQKHQADWVSILNCYIGAYQPTIFSLKFGRREYFSEKPNLPFFGLAIYYMLNPLFGKAWLTGFKTLFR